MRPPPGGSRGAAEQTRLEAAFSAMPAGYRPRTHNWDADQPRYINRLIHEGSPYLRQHAHNPVDWWAWGDEALKYAAAQDMPIFLSAGYATCHWCHVMEDESFDNPDVAALLNAHFVAVKLDREQRPDIDQIYILATTMQHRHAGWPNSVWMMPDGRPFHTGTYFRKLDFMRVLSSIATAWEGDGRSELTQFADQLSNGIRNISTKRNAAAPLDNAPQKALEQLRGAFNNRYGGFSDATQFPHEGYILFLLDHWQRSGDAEALKMALYTLNQISAGGIHDHVGGGFHRYAVDENWRTPHFEKMLYNQALLLRCFTAAWQITGRSDYARTAARCIDYVLRDMTDTDGVFFAAEDADSLNADGAREEGYFYCWPVQSARDVLGPDADFTITLLGLDQPETIEAGPIAHLEPGNSPDILRLNRVLETMRKARIRRPAPFRDEKIIGGWNGLMIRAMTEAGAAFERPDWIEAAAKAANAVFARLQTDDGMARLYAGGVSEAANLSDYVWLGEACLALSDAGEPDFLDQAEALARDVLAQFDTGDDRFALVRDGTPLGPVMEIEDGAVPSGESSALEFLANLDLRRPDLNRKSRATALREALSGSLSEMPVARLTALIAARLLQDGPAGYQRALAGGAVDIMLVRRENWHLVIDIAPGWHIAGTITTEEAPLRISGAKAQFTDAVQHQGRLDIPLSDVAQILTIELQPCTNEYCAMKETIKFRVYR